MSPWWATTPAEWWPRLGGDFPKARLVVIPDCRTYVAEDQPERLAGLIAEFVAPTHTDPTARPRSAS